MATGSTELTAEVYLAQLGRRGVEYVFANAGTDFAPIIEALSRRTGNVRYPRFITVPHENVAMSMAYGYYRASGKMAGVMVHVSVGTANAICGLMNAARDNVPILLAAGRTPLTETGHIASRNRSIHWGQECFDQGAMVREFVKWDYELRHGQPAATIVDRALDIAMSEPRGPVYLTLPREVLTESGPRSVAGSNAALGTIGAEAAREAIEEAAGLIAEAEFPLVITTASGRTAQGFHALSKLARDFALPVIQSDARDINISTDHEMNLGFEPVASLISRADVVLVLDCPVPWYPAEAAPRSGAKLIHLAPDPMLTTYPFHGFQYDLKIAGSLAPSLGLLAGALGRKLKGGKPAVEKRRKLVAELRAEAMAARAKQLEAAKRASPINVAHIAHCINELKSEDAIVISELGAPIGQLNLTEPGTFIGSTTAGGLGLALGAGLGAKLAAPQREVIVTCGDGSYMFGNPLPYHFVQKAEKLPTLTIVCNNSSWHAVRMSTLSVFPKGAAASANTMPLTELTPSPAYEKMIETTGGLGLRVEAPDQLMPAMKRAFEAIRSGTPALLNVITAGR